MPIAVRQHSWALTFSENASVNIYPYVYRLDHPVTGEFYIGVRLANKLPAESDLGHKYFTSSKFVKPRFNEFTHQIIAEFFDKDAAYEFEQELIFENKQNSNILNRHCVMSKSWINHNYKVSSKTKEKISIALRSRSDETKLKMSQAKLGIPRSTKVKEKISNTLRRPKPKVVCRIHDKREMDIGNFFKWFNRLQGVAPQYVTV